MSGRTTSLKEPLSNRKLTTREQIILLESSRLHGSVFPPWTTAPTPAEFDLPFGDGLYMYVCKRIDLRSLKNDLQPRDNAEFPLSAVQAEVFDSWRRPNEQDQARKYPAETSQRPPSSLDLVQDIVADCSVVASLCAITAQTARGGPDVLDSSIFPYDHDACEPMMSRNGKYVFRFYFNGCYRKVIIDDRLPSSHGPQALHVVDRNDRHIYWPALVEKAYLKMRGGYDFPGSNSGTDLWILTGWLPEQVFLQR